MNNADFKAQLKPGTNLAAHPYVWADADSPYRQPWADRFLEAFEGLTDIIPPDAVFTQTVANGPHFSGYVFGGLPNADSWCTFPWLFLGNASVPPEFFAAGVCEGSQGNTFWITVAIRTGTRALWLRAATGTIFGGDFMAAAQAICSDALRRWHAGDQIVVAGIHVERLPSPLPSPLFTDRIVDDRPESWPEVSR